MQIPNRTLLKPDKLYKFSSNMDFDAFLISLIQLFKHAIAVRQEAFLQLSKGEIDFLYSYVEEYLPGSVEDKNEDTDGEMSEDEEEKLLRFFKLAQKVDYKKLFYAGHIILNAFKADAIKRIKQLEPAKNDLIGYNIEQTDSARGDVILSKNTKFGLIIIGGPGQTIYTKNAAVIIDFGGDDIYYNNAGASTRDIPLSLLVDFSGNDKYITSQPFSQGSGLLGTGILMDLSGDDFYKSEDMAQGIGAIGSGFLIDLKGDDVYSGKSSVQGVGLFGMGLILEGGGNDRYLAELAAQGIGFTKGIGAIVEANGSDYMFAGGKHPDFRDPDNATKSFAQGFGYGFLPYKTSVGVSGGIGIVYDQNGNDTYVSDYFGQGASYWYAFGALVDDAGDDIYISGRYSQGAGIHSSIGILIDEEGDDHYLSTFGVSQGCGHDFGIGVLVDNGGHDFYKGEVLVQGFGNDSGIGILYDKTGNDNYVSGGAGPGRANSSSNNGGGIGIHVDSEGKDNYSNGEKDHQVLSRQGQGLFLDL